MKSEIYLDYNASTPIAPEVTEAMHPYLAGHYGNPSSLHFAGVPAKAALERARGQVSALIGCAPGEVVFTSGGSESNNHAIKGTFFACEGSRKHVITTAVEHPAVIEPVRFLQRLGAEVSIVPVDKYGVVDPDDIRKEIRRETILVSVMHANNEVGTIEPVEEISRITREYGIPFHTDAAQSVGKIPVDVNSLGVDLLTIAGHKLYAPKGLGALYVRQGTKLESFVHGAGHEGGRRAGTESVLLAVGLGKACEIAPDFMNEEVRLLRDLLFEKLKEAFGDDIVLNGHPEMRLPNTLNVSFSGKMGSAVLDRLDGVAASTGSACHAGETALSPVQKAMGVSEETGLGAVRFSLGRMTRRDEILEVVERLRHF
ncbi:MAG: cysteine desulfurase [Deltaproteobacteria bacterium]|nr:cysteine desulfurase [Deltaproteobacteria bacterium]